MFPLFYISTQRHGFKRCLRVRMIASSSNGRTADSDSVNLGSSPGEAANINNRLVAVFLLADLPEVKKQAVRGATGAKVSVAMTQWRQPSELLSR